MELAQLVSHGGRLPRGLRIQASKAWGLIRVEVGAVRIQVSLELSDLSCSKDGKASKGLVLG